MGNIRVEIIKGNILNVLSDAIVLPANTALKEGSGVSTAIFQAAGRKSLTEACSKIGSCEEGKAVVTPGYDLEEDYIIHTVVPRWIDGNHSEYERLCAAYLAALRAADILGCKSISFPLLGAGNNGYDLRIAFDIAYQTAQQFEGNNLETAYLTVFGEKASSLIAEKHLDYVEIPEVYIKKSFEKHETKHREKGAVEKALAGVGEFLGKKENWDAMLEIAVKIVNVVKMIK